MCNRSNEEVQQILLSQFSDDEVEIVYLPQDKLSSAYEATSGAHGDLQLGFGGSGRTLADDYCDLKEAQEGHLFDQQPFELGGQKQASFRRKLSLSSIAHMWSR